MVEVEVNEEVVDGGVVAWECVGWCVGEVVVGIDVGVVL